MPYNFLVTGLYFCCFPPWTIPRSRIIPLSGFTYVVPNLVPEPEEAHGLENWQARRIKLEFFSQTGFCQSLTARSVKTLFKYDQTSCSKGTNMTTTPDTPFHPRRVFHG